MKLGLDNPAHSLCIHPLQMPSQRIESSLESLISFLHITQVELVLVLGLGLAILAPLVFLLTVLLMFMLRLTYQ